MQYQKIRSAKAINQHLLAIEFYTGEKKVYDILPLLKVEMFRPLQNPLFFKNVQVEACGYAVYWNEDIDISEHELWIHGKSEYLYKELS